MADNEDYSPRKKETMYHNTYIAIESPISKDDQNSFDTVQENQKILFQSIFYKDTFEKQIDLFQNDKNDKKNYIQMRIRDNLQDDIHNNANFLIIKQHQQNLNNGTNSFTRVTKLTLIEKIGRLFKKPPIRRHYNKLIKFYNLIQFVFYQISIGITLEYISLIMIILNTIFIFISFNQQYENIYQVSEIIFIIYFFGEIIIKYIGFQSKYSKQTFWSQNWNVFDFSIVIITLLTYVMTKMGLNLIALRPIRAVRPLRTISNIKQLRKLMKTVITSFPQLMEIFFIIIFMYYLYAIIGLNLFSGFLQQKCVGIVLNDFINPDKYCLDNSYCPKGYQCTDIQMNPDHNITHFNNIFNSLLMSYQVTLLNGWYDIMSKLMISSAIYMKIIIVLYFLSNIFIVTFVLTNLLLAVIFVKFTQTQVQVFNPQLKDNSGQHGDMCICNHSYDYRKLKYHGILLPLSNLSKNFKYNKDNIQNKKFILKQQPNKLILKNKYSFIISEYEEQNIDTEEPNQYLNTQKQQKVNVNLDNDTPLLKNNQFGSLKTIATIRYNAFQVSKRVKTLLQKNNNKIYKQMHLSNLDNSVNYQQNKFRNYPFRKIITNYENQLQTVFHNRCVQAQDKEGERLTQKFVGKRVENYKVDGNFCNVLLNPEILKADRLIKPQIQKRDHMILNLSDKNVKDWLPTYQLEIPSHIIPKKPFLPQLTSQKLNQNTTEKQNQPTRQLVDSQLGNIQTSLDEIVINQNTFYNPELLHNRFSKDLSKILSFYMYFKYKKPLCHSFSKQKKQKEGNQEQENLQKLKIIKWKSMKLISKFFEEDFQEQLDAEYNQEHDQQNDDQELFNKVFYQKLCERDSGRGMINKLNWSGNTVIKSTELTSNKVKAIQQQVNTEFRDKWRRGLDGIIQKIKYNIRMFFNSDITESIVVFKSIISLCLFSATGLVSESVQQKIEKGNMVLTFIFISEVVFKLFGYKFEHYCSDSLNVFDLFVAFVQTFDMLIQTNATYYKMFKILRTLRVIRVIRITRLIRKLKFMQIIAEVISRTIKQFAYIALMLLLLMTIYTMIGMSLFQNKFNFHGPDEIKRQNFDTIPDSFLTLFQIMNIYNWQQILFALLRCDQYTIIGVTYIVSWILFSNYILLNLFRSIILNGFTVYNSKSLAEEHLDEDIIIAKEIQRERLRGGQPTVGEDQYIQNYKKQHINMKDIMNLVDESQKQQMQQGQVRLDPKTLRQLQENFMIRDINSVLNIKTMTYISSKNDTKTKKMINNINKLYCNDSLFIFSINHWFRKLSIKIVLNTNYKNLQTVLLFVSCLKLIIDTYSDYITKQQIYTFLNILDVIVYTNLFGEIMLKIVAYGFFMQEGSYLRDIWRVMDFAFGILLFINSFLTVIGATIPITIQLISSTRIILLISHKQNLKHITTNLVHSLGKIMNIFFLIILVTLMFAIIGVHLMNGNFSYCKFQDKRNYFGINEQNCSNLGGQWVTKFENFNNVFSGMLTLFMVLQGVNWNIYMYYAMDSGAPDQGPSHFQVYYISTLFVIFYFLVSILLVDFLGGVIFYEFNNRQQKKRKKNIKTISDEQVKWIMMQKLIKKMAINPFVTPKPSSGIRGVLQKITHMPLFEWCIIFFICLNILLFSFVYYKMSPTLERIIEILNDTTTFAFLTEAIIKLIANGYSVYFQLSWNKFDFFIVVVSLTDFFMKQVMEDGLISDFGEIFKIIRVMRVFNLLKLLKNKKLQQLQKVVRTVMISFPAIFNVILIWLSIYYIYCIIGFTLYNGHHGDFTNFGFLFVNLFNYSVGNNWPNVVELLFPIFPISSILFFTSFIFLTYFIMYHIFILVIVQQFQDFYLDPENPVDSFEDIADEFRKVWDVFSKGNHGMKIKSEDIYKFFICLRCPMGFYVPQPGDTNFELYSDNFRFEYFESILQFDVVFVQKTIVEMRIIEDDDGFVDFGQVFYAAMKNAFGKQCYSNADSDMFKKLKEVELKTLSTVYKHHKNQKYAQVLKREIHSGIANTNIVSPIRNTIYCWYLLQLWCNHTLKNCKIESDAQQHQALYGSNHNYFHITSIIRNNNIQKKRNCMLYPIKELEEEELNISKKFEMYCEDDDDNVQN